MRIRTTLFAAVLTTFLAAGPALPQDPGQYRTQDPSHDPPSRVARLNWLYGNVSFQPAGIDTWTGATLNYPLTTGDHIYTDSGARAEIHVGPNALRLNGESNFGFLNLDDRTVQARFTEGSLEIRLRRLDDDDLYEIDTPQGAVSLLRTGDYRIDTDPSRNATMITVISGEANVSTNNGGGFIVRARQTAYIPEGFDPDIREANPPDDFDGFTRDRNIREDRVPPPVHVSQSMAGYEDLDQYGAWSQSQDYGWVWAPRVEAGWAPYHQGRWAWVEPWGWTWIDEAPWGFAPFHYGRWAYAGNRWIWAPGAVIARPVYAPALVAFVGGPRFGLSINIGGGGAVGWFPLGPREPFYPAYRVSNNYVRQVNVTHVTNINVTNVNVNNIQYVNQQVPGAVVAMPQQGFINARPVREMGQRVSPQQIAQAQVIGAAPQITPRRESMMGIPTNRTVAAPSQAVMSRAVIANSAAPPPPVSFQARQQMLQQNKGQPLAQEQLMQLRQQPGAVMNRPQVRMIAPQSSVAPQPAFAPRQPAGRAGDQPGQPVFRQSMPIPPARPVDRPTDRQMMDRPAERMDTRPPNARPVMPDPVPAVAPRQPDVNRPQPEFNRPQPQERPAPVIAPRPAPENRPQPQERPAPVFSPRPAPENRPQPEMRRESPPFVREPRVEPAPQRQERPVPPPKEQKDEKKDGKKDK